MRKKIKSQKKSERIDLLMDPDTLETLLKVVALKYSTISEITRIAIREYANKELSKE